LTGRQAIQPFESRSVKHSFDQQNWESKPNTIKFAYGKRLETFTQKSYQKD
jgi:hypothetical protein